MLGPWWLSCEVWAEQLGLVAGSQGLREFQPLILSHALAKRPVVFTAGIQVAMQFGWCWFSRWRGVMAHACADGFRHAGVLLQ